ncbi:MAG: peptidase T [Lachnospiraceae bacterium]|nr:peptidase T [Lachnospiraceae bacterium]
MHAYERFLKYVTIHTTSDRNAEGTPSADRQFDLANYLVEEMKALGIEDARVDEKCYVYGSIPATEGLEDKVSLGFLAHLDTSPDYSGEDVKPQMIENYDGGEVKLKGGVTISPELFPHLSELKGKTLITSDGTTLLGADDKAGIAEIMTMAETILKTGVPHGKICIGFTPDEEIGSGAQDLDLAAFGADFCYTVDGGAENEVECENFNASEAFFEITGRSVHPGYAKGKMINAALLAVRIANMLPQAETPALTSDREGFFHLHNMEGSVEKAKMRIIIRDHSAERFEGRLETLRHIEKTLNEEYPAGTVKLIIKDQYRNMIEVLQEHMHLIDNAIEAMKAAGISPITPPVRGGTDGAALSFRGLPCPNLGTGGYAYHGPYEHITSEGMDAVVQVLLGIVDRYAGMKQ